MSHDAENKQKHTWFSRPLAHPWLPWHHHQAISRMSWWRTDISFSRIFSLDITFSGIFSLFVKLQSLCCKNQPEDVSPTRASLWGWLSGAWITSSASRKVSSSVSCQHHILKPVSINPCLWMCCVQGKILEQKLTQHSFLVILYSAKGAPHCSSSSISIILIPFWTPCLKNALAKDSKTQLRKPAPVIEILPFWMNSVQFGFSILSLKTDSSFMDAYCVHVRQWLLIAMFLSWGLNHDSSSNWILGTFKMFTFLKISGRWTF